MMNEPELGNFDNMNVSSPNVSSSSPPHAQSTSSAAYAQSTPPVGTSTSRTKRKAPMVDVLDAQMEKITRVVDRVVEAVVSGNALKKKLLQVAERQVHIAERQVVAFEKRNDLIREQVNILKSSSTIQYSEADVWELVQSFNLTDENLMYSYYVYLCNNESQRRRLFGMPAHLRLNHLLKMMSQSGLLQVV